MAAVEEEEVVGEVEATRAVYGDDCVVLDSYPPHLHLHIKPRTADVTSQQFVEAVIGIRATSQYPKEPPQVYLVDSKGLDEQRQKLLTDCIGEKASELSSCLMLVYLCEEAVEKLTAMNHPDGECPLCLFPLFPEDNQNKTLPFMKLMSCFHCFHCECIIRWWNWLQTEQKTIPRNSSNARAHSIKDNENKKEESIGNCPVCRKVFHTKDFEHVLDLVGSHFSASSFDENEAEDNEKILYSDSENIRRHRFEATLKLQQENSGLIEPVRTINVSSGMFLPQQVTQPAVAAVVSEESNEQQQRNCPLISDVHTGGSSQRPNAARHKNPYMRRQRPQNSKRSGVQQWVRKENGAAK
ncbi:hypothetical protein UlMin_036708 [Ulmus minor]